MYEDPVTSYHLLRVLAERHATGSALQPDISSASISHAPIMCKVHPSQVPGFLALCMCYVFCWLTPTHSLGFVLDNTFL